MRASSRRHDSTARRARRTRTRSGWDSRHSRVGPDEDASAFAGPYRSTSRTVWPRSANHFRLAAALPGAVAAQTDLPVIGVPFRSEKSVLDGLDALLSIAQLPPGVPVAAVGVDNARNAAILAARILAG